MEIETKTYYIYAGIGSTDEDVRLVDTIELDSDLEAREYAQLCAHSVYNLTPNRTIPEIMESEDVSEEQALKIYTEEMTKSVVFFALEYDEDGVMTRHY
jgi:cellobiose phosphorylase